MDTSSQQQQQKQQSLGVCSWQLLLDPVEAAVRSDVEMVVALARQLIATSAGRTATAGSRRTAAAKGPGGWATGEPFWQPSSSQ